jgi:hypothetical protein
MFLDDIGRSFDAGLRSWRTRGGRLARSTHMPPYLSPHPSFVCDRRSFAKLVQRIREEFEETPGLEIDVHDGARFWALDRFTCELVLKRLHDVKFLVRTTAGRYRRSSAV